MKTMIDYPELAKRMAAYGVNSVALARVMDVAPCTVRRKLAGHSPFTLEECIRVRGALAPALTVEELFVHKGGGSA